MATRAMLRLSWGRLMLSLLMIVIFQGKHSCTAASSRSNVSMAEFVEDILNRKGYRSNVRPGIDVANPTQVTLNIFVNSISSIDDFNMEYSMTFYLRQRWQDPRLAYTQINRTVTLNYNDLHRIWVPDLFFRNEKAGMLHDITVPNRLIRLWPNGTLLYSQRISLRLDCYMQLHKFPFDDQTCKAEIGSYGYTTADLVFIWQAMAPLSIREQMELPEFAIASHNVGDCTRVFSTGTFACVYAEFHFVRKFEYYLLQTYIPSVMVVVLSWVSFWIDIEAVPARISLGLLTVLTMTTQASTISARLPRVSYIKGIDVWMSSCLLFVFGALIEYSAVNVLYRRKPKSPGEWEGEEARDTDSLCQNDLNKHGTPNKLARDLKDSDRAYMQPKAKNQWMPKCCQHAMQNKAICIDVSSRFLFPISFLVFNLMYWILYGLIL